MVTLVVTEQGTRLSVAKGRVVVRKDRKTVHDLPAETVERILVFGTVEVGASLLRAAFRDGWDVVFFSRDARYKGRLQGSLSRNVRLRVRQILRMQEADFRLQLARAIVEGKIRNQRALLMRAQRTYGDPAIARSVARMRLLVGSLRGAGEVDAVRGYEGAAAAAYFAAFGRAIRNPAFSFHGRNKRPPRDPVNACLSFGYAILTGVMGSIVERVGLDPMVGALHDLDYGRPSLVLDLIEEWRPVLVDAVVLRLLNRRQLVAQDFGPPDRDLTEVVLAGGEPPPADEEEAVHLQRTGRRVLIRELLRRLRERVFVEGRGVTLAYEKVLEAQAYRIGRVVAGEEDAYLPHRVR